jgi:two-component system, NarL family, nitrate/nitrite sensor histidine kinase NarX
VLLRTGLIMGCITLMALFSMVSTIVIAETARGDAAALNMAGSLRMQAFRIATQLLSEPGSAFADRGTFPEMREFDRRLRSDILLEPIPKRPAHPVQQAYNRVEQRWEREMKPLLLSYLEGQQPDARTDFLSQVENFSHDVDHLVRSIQREAETRIQLLRLLQGIAIFLTLGLVFLAMYLLRATIMQPLGELLAAARRAQRGDLSVRVSHTTDDEIGTLGASFNTMAESLEQMRRGLEREVERKTADLTRSNDALKLLYETARSLTPETLDADLLRSTLRRLSEIVDTGPVTLCLGQEGGARAYRSISVHPEGAPEFCEPPAACARCMEQTVSRRGTARTPGVASIPLVDKEQHYGVLLLEYAPGGLPAPWKLRLAEAVADQIATALTRSNQSREKRRLALMEERAVIARELHDSLAQSLSYLKIQVSRLQTLSRKGPANPALDPVLQELRKGLNESYRHLRELLANFRLQMNEEGLEQALQETAAEFSKRGGINIELDVGLEGPPLESNHEVHLLHIAREALSNVVQHARASTARLSLHQTSDGACTLTVDDDGLGIPEHFEKIHHYGTRIMRERADSLGGTFSIGRAPTGGTRVQVRFTPDTVHSLEDRQIR